MLTINISNTIWTLICFLLLYFGLKKFLYDPLIRFMDERRARIDSGFNAEREAKKQVEDIDGETQRQLQQQNDEARQTLALAKAEQERERERRISEEKAKAREDRHRAMSDGGSAQEEELERELPALARRLADIILQN